MKYIKTGNQVADIFTKALSGTKFEEFRRQLGMTTRFKIKEKNRWRGVLKYHRFFKRSVETDFHKAEDIMGRGGKLANVAKYQKEVNKNQVEDKYCIRYFWR